MSRWRDDEREDAVSRTGGSAEAAAAAPSRERGEDLRHDGADRAPRADAFVERLDLPRGDARETVHDGPHTVRLDGDDVRVLATVGTFRAVPVSDLGEAVDTDRGTLRHLRDHGLVDIATVSRGADEARRDTSIVVLTAAGKAVLDAHTRTHDGARQAYHAGLVKPQELAHDASLHRVYRVAERDLAAEGRHVTRVVLDYELKAEYQRFLNRADRPANATLEVDRAAFAAAHGLTVVDGHLELPDLRLEYEGRDGERGVRDVELVTEHYSRAQVAGKAAAGFAMYRASRPGGRATRGGTPYDPHTITRVFA